MASSDASPLEKKSLVGTLIGHFPSPLGGGDGLSMCATTGSGPLTMVAGPIVEEATGGPAYARIMLSRI